MKPGFVPALVTPLDTNGKLDEASYRKQIEDQIAAGAVALLSMGSMGQQPYLRNSVCVDVDRVAVDAMIKNGYKGIVYAGVGNGNIHKNVFPALEEARKDGIIVVRSSRVPTGATTLDAEVDDNKYQFIASWGLNPQKARILLMLAMTKTNNWKTIQGYFNEF